MSELHPLKSIEVCEQCVIRYGADVLEKEQSVADMIETDHELAVVRQARLWGIRDSLVDTLVNNGVEEFFAVQESIIPLLLRLNSHSCVQPRDLCVSAPTGSGKTLSYAVPIVSILQSRLESRRLRALVVLPSRELATQVYGVFAKLLVGTDLVVYNSVGHTDFEEEQQLLVGPSRKRKYFDSSGASSLFSNQDLYINDRSDNNDDSHHDQEKGTAVVSFRQCPRHSNVDILVCTPSRLLDHIHQTPGFSLEHLRFLILDEADRLLGNAYSYWVKSLVDSTRHSTGNLSSDHSGSQLRQDSRPPIQRLLFSATLTDNPRKLGHLGIRNPMIIRVGAVTETLRNDHGDEKKKKKGVDGNDDHDVDIHVNAEYNDDGEHDDDGAVTAEGEKEISTELPSISGQGSDLDNSAIYMLPTTLSESYKVCDTADKPINLLAILSESLSDHSQAENSEDHEHVVNHEFFASRQTVRECDGNMCMVFASSVETTHRLSTLLKIYNGQSPLSESGAQLHDDAKYRFGGRVEEISRVMTPVAREQTLRDAAAGLVKVLVSSDNMARGIDVANIMLVINYDPPKFAKTYVHRAGRTARANRSGHCLTMLKKGQVGAFRKMRGSIGNGNEKAISAQNQQSLPRKYKVNKVEVARVTPLYTRALSQLSDTFAEADDE